jgi:hypothetical protein
VAALLLSRRRAAVSRRLTSCLSTLVLLGVAADCSKPEATGDLPVIRESGLTFIEIAVEGGGAVLALIDTGANASAVDPGWTAHLPATARSEIEGTTGIVEAEMVEVSGLRLGLLELPALEATRRDLGGLIAPPGRSVGMILGSDAFLGMAITIDFEKGTFQVDSDPPEPPAASAVMLLDNGIPSIRATIGGVDAWLRIDTGASLFDTPDVYINIPTRLWCMLSAGDSTLRATRFFVGSGADGQPVDLPVVRVPGANIGPLDLKGVFVIVQPNAGYFARPDAKGFVSNNYLKQLGRVTLDYRSGRLYTRAAAAEAPATGPGQALSGPGLPNAP